MGSKRLRIVVTGGGSGGHANPAVAFVEGWRSQAGAAAPDFQYLGSHAGIEATLAAARGIPYHPISTGKLRRYFSLRNAADALRVAAGLVQAARLLVRLRPDAVFSTGGFVSVPVVAAAWLLRIPVMAHEQTVSSGLANRIAGRLADRIAISFASSAAHFPAHKVVLTGIPLRQSLFEGDAARFRVSHGFEASLPLVYVTGGAQGSRVLNEAVRQVLPRLVAGAFVAHQCGRHSSYDALGMMRQAAAALPPEQASRYLVFDYLDQGLGDLMAATTLLIGRAGAGTVCEALALALPAVLVPLATSAGDEQRKNARLLADAGQALVIEEAELNGDRLLQAVRELLEEPQRLEAMRQASRGLFIPGAVGRLVAEMEALAGRRGGDGKDAALR
ncbi:MAG: UDP-N-acetylglucosamine--N-acetylmuramyl-(pentapeptide) pyrophosphoryl-undecaprenol N-acetylglucosamine transferase [Candidatus Riflebacteria bacterium]|nr:UDP-N-acetylglucosamine--N-acetylmuramyl-(pentapeptide) pyrophosphoryl-undecaprenol N-acetylglucosamine transferase [Candidatus Riflebacteria bacterium]